MEYILKFEMPYIKCDNYKEKDLINLIGVITGTRINDFVNDYKYAHIFFDEDDKQHWHPNVVELDNFTRSKTNCVVFNINSDIYQKLFIYQTLNRENPYYGIVGLKHNGECAHIYFLELDYSALVINMNRMIHRKKYQIV